LIELGWTFVSLFYNEHTSQAFPGMQKQAANLFDEMVIGASKDGSAIT
jgi:hypothetical protein